MGYIKNRKIVSSTIAVAMLVFAQMVMVLPVRAAAGEAVWDNEGGDGLFSTVENWEGDVLPQDGDIFAIHDVFDGSDFGSGLENDLSISFGGAINDVEFSVPSDGDNNINYIDTMTFEDGATIRSTQDEDLTYGDVIGEGNLNIGEGYDGYPDYDVAGTLTYLSSSDKDHYFPSGSYAAIGIQKGAILSTAGDNVTTPIIAGGGTGDSPVLNFRRSTYQPLANGSYAPSAAAPGPYVPPEPTTYTVNSVTLNSNLKISVGNPDTVYIKNIVKNGYSVSLTEGSTGKLKVGGQTTSNPKTATKLDGNKPSESVTITGNQIATLNGTRGAVGVQSGGTLKGNGTVASLSVGYDATLAPGNSPGKITVTGAFTLLDGSTYNAEIFDKDSYDQVVADSVSLNNAILDLDFLAGGKVNKGDAFRIIDNKGSNPVGGTFADLAQGAKITIGNAVFVIDYEGGTGNDVVLTALTTASAPGTPNTGFTALVTANPLLTAVLGVVAAGTLYVASRRRN
jgi:hypothetical protein